MMSEELKPCPFCGGAATTLSGGPGNCYVQCMTCKTTSNDASISTVVERWNARADNATIEALRKELSECKAERDECSRLYTNSVSENDALRIALDVANKHYESKLTAIRNETIDECAAVALDEDGEFTDWGEDRNRTISIQTAQRASVAIRMLKETT